MRKTIILENTIVGVKKANTEREIQKFWNTFEYVQDEKENQAQCRRILLMNNIRKPSVKDHSTTEKDGQIGCGHS